MDNELFTTRMKKATRKAHAVSDALVNAKLLFGLNNDGVWAEGLLIFYEIFKFLEYAMKEKREENLGKLFIPGMSRTSAFESDLNHYLGPEWKKNYKIRESVGNYLNHLKKLLETDSDLLMAYVYHLYMGLLSGGQILSKKRQLQSKITKSGGGLGEAVTYFENEKISDLKSQLKTKMNVIAEELDERKKYLLVEESIKVFELNNSIIRTVQGAGKAAFRNVSIFTACIILIIAVIYYYSRFLFTDKINKSNQTL